MKQLNCDAAGTTSTFLRFLVSKLDGTWSSFIESSGTEFEDKFGILIGVGYDGSVNSGTTIKGPKVGTSAGGFVGGVAGAVDCVVIGTGVGVVNIGGEGFVGLLLTGGFVGIGVNSGSFGSNVVEVTAGIVVVGNTIALHCCATKFSDKFSQFSQTKQWSWAEAVKRKFNLY